MADRFQKAGQGFVRLTDLPDQAPQHEKGEPRAGNGKWQGHKPGNRKADQQ